jgi:hypothetical protein
MSESPRRLESVGRYEEAEAMLQKIERGVALQRDSLARRSVILMIVFLVVQILVVHFYGIGPRMRRLEEIQ